MELTATSAPVGIADRLAPIRRRLEADPLLAWAVLTVSTVGLIAAKWNESERRRVDFHIYYQAVRDSRPASLYDYAHPTQKLGFTYPPFSALIIWPLTWVSEHAAELTWLTVSTLLAALFWVVCAKRIGTVGGGPLPSWAVPLVAAAGVWTLPVVLTVRIGQINAFVAVMLALEVVLLERRSKLSGLGIGAATAMKLTPGLLIPFLWFCGRRREAAQAAVFTLCFTAVGALAYPSDTRRYFRTELWDTNRVGSLDRKLNNGLRRYIAWLPWDNAVQSLIWIVLVAAVVVVGFPRARAAFRNGDVLRSVALVMCVSYVVSPITWSHHMWFAGVLGAIWLFEMRSRFDLLVGLIATAVIFDPFEGGEGSVTSIIRTVVMLVLIAQTPVGAGAAPLFDVRSGWLGAPLRGRLTPRRADVTSG